MKITKNIELSALTAVIVALDDCRVDFVGSDDAGNKIQCQRELYAGERIRVLKMALVSMCQPV